MKIANPGANASKYLQDSSFCPILAARSPVLSLVYLLFLVSFSYLSSFAIVDQSSHYLSLWSVIDIRQDEIHDQGNSLSLVPVPEYESE